MSIKVSRETLGRLRGIASYGESMDTVIRRLLDETQVLGPALLRVLDAAEAYATVGMEDDPPEWVKEYRKLMEEAKRG